MTDFFRCVNILCRVYLFTVPSTGFVLCPACYGAGVPDKPED